MSHRYLNRRHTEPIRTEPPNPDELVARMRDDDESDWVDRLIDELGEANSPRDLPGSPLSPRELDVLRCVAVGLSLQMTGDVLGITLHTSRQHMRGAIQRLKAKNMTHAVALALRQGLIT